MKQDTDDFGELLFKPEEYLDPSRIKLLFCDFKKNEKRKESDISRPRKKVENEKPKLKKTEEVYVRICLYGKDKQFFFKFESDF